MARGAVVAASTLRHSARMESDGGAGGVRNYTLAVIGRGFRLTHPDTRLALSDDGISYEFEGRSGLRSFAQLRSVRVQSVNGGRNRPFETIVELSFERGLPLTVTSAGADDQHRDLVFVSFIEDLHRRLTGRDHGHVRFLRGAPESQYRITILTGFVLLILVGAVSLPFWVVALDARNSAFDIFCAVLGLMAIGWFIWRSRERNRPGTYDPRDPPRDLYPE